MKNDSGKLIVVILWSKASKSKDVRTPTPGFSPSVPTVGSVAEHDMKGKRNVQNDKFKDFPAPPPRYPLRVPTVGSSTKFEGKGKKLMEVTSDHLAFCVFHLAVHSSSFSIHSLVSLSRITMADGKDFFKVVITNDHYEYILAKYEKRWVHDESMVGIVYNDLLERVNMKPKLVKEVIVISSDDDDLSTNEQITLIGDVPFSTTDDDSDDDDTDDDDTNDESYEEQHVKKQQFGSTSRVYRKIAMTGCVLFLRAHDAPTTSFGTPIKTQVKVTNCVLALKAINVASSSKHKMSRETC
ncbi:hypothetical protein Tco_1051979 [Tanacetum coccineum]